MEGGSKDDPPKVVEPVVSTAPIVGEKPVGQDSRPAPSSRPEVHVPRWDVLRNSRLVDPDLCREFLNCALPPGERSFQRSRPRPELWDDSATNLVGLMANVCEIWREWRSFHEDRAAFEREQARLDIDRRDAADRIKNLEWDLSAARAEASEAKERHLKAAADWKIACETSNRKLEQALESGKSARARSDELEEEVAVKDVEIQKLREQVAVLDGERSALAGQVLGLTNGVEQLRADRRWLIKDCVPASFDFVKSSTEFQRVLSEMLIANKLQGRQEGFAEGIRFAEERLPHNQFPLHGIDCALGVREKTDEFETMRPAALDEITAHADDPNLDSLRSMFAEDLDGDGTGSGDDGGDDEEEVDYSGEE